MVSARAGAKIREAIARFDPMTACGARPVERPDGVVISNRVCGCAMGANTIRTEFILLLRVEPFQVNLLQTHSSLRDEGKAFIG